MSINKKAAIVSAVFPPYRGGIGTVAYHHARLLAEQGCEVTVFTPNYQNSQKPKPPPLSSLLPGGEVVRVNAVVKYGNAAYIPSLKDKLKDFDAVILEYPFFGGAGAVLSAKKKYGFKLLLYYHMDTAAHGLKGLVFKYTKKFFLPKIIKRADIVMASSEDYARHSALRKFWKNNDKFRVLPIGVDIERFKASEPDLELKKNLNIKDDEKIILFVGGLDKAHYFKGVEYLIRAIPFVSSPRPLTLSGDGTGFKVIIAGKGELQAEYKRLAEKLGVRDKVMFTGGVSDKVLVKLYQLASVTVLPSIDQSEAFGIVLVESMACGTPVITSDLTGVRSVYQDGVSGFKVAPKDEKALAEKIQFILSNEDKVNNMRKEARKLVEEKYNWKKIGEELIQLIS